MNAITGVRVYTNSTLLGNTKLLSKEVVQACKQKFAVFDINQCGITDIFYFPGSNYLYFSNFPICKQKKVILNRYKWVHIHMHICMHVCTTKTKVTEERVNIHIYHILNYRQLKSKLATSYYSNSLNQNLMSYVMLVYIPIISVPRPISYNVIIDIFNKDVVTLELSWKYVKINQ